ncbi:hypothetical protein SBA4_3770003 [Candidatus Sulfopaludibacter sp. SbA4]|nr:hypothetical protein SBA4_3770003 [Candidatus Sulfopaludibacter sp. SbA4]
MPTQPQVCHGHQCLSKSRDLGRPGYTRTRRALQPFLWANFLWAIQAANTQGTGHSSSVLSPPSAAQHATYAQSAKATCR